MGTESMDVKIAICDDELLIQRKLEKMVSLIVKRKGIEAKLQLYSTGAELLEEAEAFDIIFLDIEMPGEDGIEIGKKIRQKNEACKIVMATGKAERVKEVFHFGAYRFVTKPFDEEELEEVFESYLREQMGFRTMEVFLNRKPYQIYYKDIQYIQAYGSYVEVYTKNQVYRKDVTLAGMKELLNAGNFFRINRQIIVNMAWIDQKEKEYVSVNQRRMEISRRRRKEFEQAYMMFDVSCR